MVCIYCNSKTKVTNSRGSAKSHTTWRRRECIKCAGIFTTYEKPDYANALRIESATGSLKAFSRDVLFVTLNDALSHKNTATGDAGALCDTIIQQLAHEHSNGLLTTKQVAATAHEILNRYDKVAASVYKAKYIS